METLVEEKPQPTLSLDLAAPSESAAPVRIGNPLRWSIAGDVIHRATESLPEFERDQIRWLGRWASQQNLPISDVAAVLKKPSGEAYSTDTVYQVMTGRRTAQGVSLKGFADSVAQLRRREREQESRLSTAFISTPLTKRIFAVCGRAYRKGRLGVIIGRSQVGKTTALAEYARQNNHGQTTLVRMPTRGGLTHFLGEMAQLVRVPSQRREDEVRRRIMDCFDERNLLIVDEAHQCLHGRGDGGAMTLEFIREIHDRRHCGVILCGTDVLRQALIHNKLLNQLWLRRAPGCVIRLPDVVPAKDLEMFAAAFNLDPAPDKDISVKYLTLEGGAEVEKTFRANPLALQTQITTDAGLGAWVKLLDDAKDLAEERQTQIRWSHVLVAWCLAKAQEEA